MLKELSDQYEEKRAASEAAISQIQAKARHHLDAAETLEKRAERHRQAAEKLEEKMRKIPAVDWKKEVIEPLAEELALV